MFYYYVNLFDLLLVFDVNLTDMETLESLFYRGNHLVLLIMLATVGTKHQHFLVKSVCLQRGMRVIWNDLGDAS